MALVTLAITKALLGQIASDAVFGHMIGHASGVIRKYCGSYLYGVASEITAGANGVLRMYGHEFQTGDSVRISQSNCTPAIDDDYEITVLDRDRFSVDEEVDSGGTFAMVSPIVHQVVNSAGGNSIFVAPPVQELLRVWVDVNGEFGDDTELELDDCRLGGLDRGVSQTGQIFRNGDTWPAAARVTASGMQTLGDGVPASVKVEYVAGSKSIMTDVQAAAVSLVKRLAESLKKGGLLKSESLDYYSYSLATGEEELRAIGALNSILSRRKQWVI